MPNILFVCTGNINRSAAAHVILEFHSSGHKVQSCGTSKLAVDRSRMAPKMRRIMTEMGYSGENHIAQPFNQDLFNWSDQIICMSHLHISRINKHFNVDQNKITNWEIIDPFHYKGDDTHRATAQQIKERVFHHFLN